MATLLHIVTLQYILEIIPHQFIGISPPPCFKQLRSTYSLVQMFYSMFSLSYGHLVVSNILQLQPML